MQSAASAPVPGALAIQLQPQVSFRDGAIEGAEVLARWRMPDGRMLTPDVFMRLLEVDWTHPMFGRDLVALAIDAQVQLTQTDRNTRLWINLVPSMLESTDWLQTWFIDPCIAAGVPVSSFGFELTETALLKSFDDARDVLATLQSMGSHVALDDFGTGFSSLSHLRALPASVVKIDKSFVATVDQQLNESAIIGAVADLSHTLGMQVLCEGVETRWQAVAVANLGVDAAQGYLFGRPVDVAEFAVRSWGGIEPIETAGFSMRRADMLSRPGYVSPHHSSHSANDAAVDADAALRSVDLATLIDSTGDVVLMIDHHSMVTWCSNSALQMFGRDANSLIGTAAFDLIHPDYAEAAADRFVRELTTPTPGYAPETYPLPLLHVDGSWVDVDVVGRPVFDGANPIGMVMCVRHSNGFPVSHLTAVTREAQFAALLASSLSTIAVVADDTTIVEVNEQIHGLIGRHAVDVVGRSFADFIDPRDLELAGTLWINALGPGNDEAGRVRLTHADGRAVWVEVMAERWTSGVHSGFVVSVADVTARMVAELTLERRAAIDAAAAAIASAALLEVGDLFLQSLDDIVEPVSALLGQSVSIVFEPPSGDGVLLGELRDGHWYVGAVGCAALDADLAGEVAPLLGALCRIVMQVRLRTEAEHQRRVTERRYQILSEGSSDLVVVCDLSGELAFVSRSVERSLGWHTDDLIGRNVLAYFHPDDLPTVGVHVDDIRAGRVADTECRIRSAGGEYRWFKIRVQPIVDPSTNAVIEVHAAGHDTTDHHVLAEQLAHLASHDQLTGLGNRQRLTDLLGGLRSTGDDVAVVMLDLDRFKVVNDVLGHEVGDQLLVDAAIVIQHVVGERGVAVRYGGDEFVVVCDRLDLEAAKALAHQLATIELYPPGHAHLLVRASVGLAWHRWPWTQATVMRTADERAYRAKRQGGGRAVLPVSHDDQETVGASS
jgi:diguanylate cyclase (GGDEF)-like protein/PAS domain S-box-containing protein